MDEERTMPGHWLGLVLCVPFSGLAVLGGRKNIWPVKTFPLISRGSLPEQVEKENPRVNRLIQDQLQQRPLNGSNSSLY